MHPPEKTRIQDMRPGQLFYVINNEEETQMNQHDLAVYMYIGERHGDHYYAVLHILVEDVYAESDDPDYMAMAPLSLFFHEQPSSSEQLLDLHLGYRKALTNISDSSKSFNHFHEQFRDRANAQAYGFAVMKITNEQIQRLQQEEEADTLFPFTDPEQAFDHMAFHFHYDTEQPEYARHVFIGRFQGLDLHLYHNYLHLPLLLSPPNTSL